MLHNQLLLYLRKVSPTSQHLPIIIEIPNMKQNIGSNKCSSYILYSIRVYGDNNYYSTRAVTCIWVIWYIDEVLTLQK